MTDYTLHAYAHHSLTAIREPYHVPAPLSDIFCVCKRRHRQQKGYIAKDLRKEPVPNERVSHMLRISVLKPACIDIHCTLFQHPPAVVRPPRVDTGERRATGNVSTRRGSLAIYTHTSRLVHAGPRRPVQRGGEGHRPTGYSHVVEAT